MAKNGKQEKKAVEKREEEKTLEFPKYR